MIAALRDPDTEVRLSAINSLSKKLKDPRAVEPLIATLKDPDLMVRTWAVEALGEFKDPRAVDALIVAMNDPHSGVERMDAAYALAEINDRRGVDAVLALSNKGNPDVIVELRRALVAIGEPGTEDALIQALNKPGGAHVLLAQALLDSRNPKLQDAARKWALKTGTPIVSVTIWSTDTSGEWGSGR